MTWRERLRAQRAATFPKGRGEALTKPTEPGMVFPKGADALLTKPTKPSFVSFGSTPDGHSGNIAVAMKAANANPFDATAARTRTAMLALADRLAVDRDHVHRLDDAGLALLEAIGEAGMRSYLLAADDSATRQAGKVPLDDTAPILCERCGPVFVHPDIAAVLPVVNGWPRALGCPWCFIRKAGGYAPRPHVTCETCAHFTPDRINPPAGLGRCACGPHYPMQRPACGTYRPASG